MKIKCMLKISKLKADYERRYEISILDMNVVASVV